MITRSNATVVPVFLNGQNSWLFQLASHIRDNLRVALLLKEFGRRADQPAKIATLCNDARGMMKYLRAQTYELSPRRVARSEYGFECEDQYKM